MTLLNNYENFGGRIENLDMVRDWIAMGQILVDEFTGLPNEMSMLILNYKWEMERVTIEWAIQRKCTRRRWLMCMLKIRQLKQLHDDINSGMRFGFLNDN